MVNNPNFIPPPFCHCVGRGHVVAPFPSATAWAEGTSSRPSFPDGHIRPASYDPFQACALATTTASCVYPSMLVMSILRLRHRHTRLKCMPSCLDMAMHQRL